MFLQGTPNPMLDSWGLPGDPLAIGIVVLLLIAQAVLWAWVGTMARKLPWWPF